MYSPYSQIVLNTQSLKDYLHTVRDKKVKFSDDDVAHQAEATVPAAVLVSCYLKAAAASPPRRDPGSGSPRCAARHAEVLLA